MQTWTAPYSGYYYVEAYGAAGGDDARRGGYGGYVKMYTYLNEGTNLYITCGQKGWAQFGNAAKVSAENPTYNGGGRAGYSTIDSQNNDWYSGIGGGATSIALSNHGELKDFVNCKNDVLMVAGGGAGGSGQSSGQGGSVLYTGSGTDYSVMNGADTSLLNGQFALGSNPGTNDGGGGGGGWIGGKSGLDAAGNSAGGGASFVNTSQNCVPIELVPDYNTKDGYVHITSTDYTGYYMISYDYDGGTANNPISYSVKQDDFTLTAPTKEGYTFTGWTGSNGDTPQKDITIKKGTAKNLSFKANWTINYYTLDLNSEVDGECLTHLPDGCTCDLYINGQLEAAGINDIFKQYPYGTTYEFKNFKTGVNLVYANKVQSTYHDKDGNLDKNCQPLKGTVKAYMNSAKYGGLTHVVPVFNTKSVNVTFHRNASSSDTQTASQTFTYGVAGQSFSDKGWSYTGHKLLGWAYSNNATEAYHTPLNGVLDSWINTHYPKVDLYAVWAPNHYTIKYDANGGIGTMADQDITYSDIDENMTRTTKCQYTKNGYLFNGWYASRVNGGKTQYLYSGPSSVRGEWYNEGSQPSGYVLYKYSNGEKTGRVTTVDKDIVTFHAQWKPIHYTIKYDSNDGTGTMADQDITYSDIDENMTRTTKCQYTKNGYLFNGWYASRVNGGKTQYLYSGPSSVRGEWYNEGSQPSGYVLYKYSNGEKTGRVTTVDKDIVTFHAQWKPIHYTIKYDSNDGTGTMADQTITYEGYTKVRPNTFTKSGYTFGGWHASRIKDGVTQYLYTSTGSNWEWYDEGKQPSGYKLYLYRYDETTGRATTIDGDAITLHAQWTPNVLTVKYHNDGGTLWESWKQGEETWVDVTNKDILDVETLEYDVDHSSYSLDNASRLTKKGYHSNYYWFVGNKNSSIRISDSKIYPKAQSLAKDAGVLDALQKGNVTIDLYPDMSPNTYTLTFDYGDKSITAAKSKTITYDSEYGALPSPQCAGWTFKGWNTKADGTGDVVTEKTMCKGLSNVTIHAQWQYNPVSVKIPQILTGDHTGKSQFRVKCDSIVAGSIAVEPDSSFNYTQDKLAVKTVVKRKSNSSVIDKNNHSVVYDIVTDKPLTAGCWQGSFNVKLTLTKE